MNNIVCDFETKNIYFCSKIKIFSHYYLFFESVFELVNTETTNTQRLSLTISFNSEILKRGSSIVI